MKFYNIMLSKKKRKIILLDNVEEPMEYLKRQKNGEMEGGGCASGTREDGDDSAVFVVVDPCTKRSAWGFRNQSVRVVYSSSPDLPPGTILDSSTIAANFILARGYFEIHKAIKQKMMINGNLFEYVTIRST